MIISNAQKPAWLAGEAGQNKELLSWMANILEIENKLLSGQTPNECFMDLANVLIDLSGAKLVLLLLRKGQENIVYWAFQAGEEEAGMLESLLDLSQYFKQSPQILSIDDEESHRLTSWLDQVRYRPGGASHLHSASFPLSRGSSDSGYLFFHDFDIVPDETFFNFAQQLAGLLSIASLEFHQSLPDIDIATASHEELHSQYDFAAIIGSHPKLMEVLQVVSQVADTDAPVLIEGETGTGKELVARAIHSNSHRREKRMVSVNCGAFPENLLESEFFGYEKGAFTGAVKSHKGKFEQASGGTIFLDEVDEMSPLLQVKLLRIIQWGEFTPLGSEETRKCDVRIVAASKRRLRELVDEGSFREDLYYRLNLIRVNLPPLRERKEDILQLGNHFLCNVCKKLKRGGLVLGSEAQKAIQNYAFPGNVRELENIIRRAAILCKERVIQVGHLPPEVQAAAKPVSESILKAGKTFKEAKEHIISEFEKKYIKKTLEDAGGIIVKAAEHAGMHEKNFRLKLKKYKIRPQK